MRTPLKNAKGFTLAEVLISTVSVTVIMAAMGSLLVSFMQWRAAPAANAILLHVMADVKKMMNLDDQMIAGDPRANRNCGLVFGAGTVIDPNLTQPHNLYNTDGSVKFYGAPSSTQNSIGNQWQLSSVQVIPYGNAEYYNPAQYLLFANLSLTVAPVNGGSQRVLAESIPLVFVLTKVTNVIMGCSSASTSNVVRLPTCTPGQHLFFVSVGGGTQPQWVCQP